MFERQVVNQVIRPRPDSPIGTKEAFESFSDELLRKQDAPRIEV